MNKIHNINVGGFPFAINEDAYFKLDQYLLQLDRHFSKSEGHAEIMGDIESRIAELFKEYMKGMSIVTLQHVEQMIQVMGTQESFDSQSDYSTANEPNYGEYSLGKRLFRDPYDKKISGVCSGIAHYIGIDDPVWVRLTFVLLGFAGFGIVTYIVLMLIVPEAVTAADRLAMKGKPINIHNIAHKVEEEINDLTDRFDEWRDKWRKKRRR